MCSSWQQHQSRRGDDDDGGDNADGDDHGDEVNDDDNDVDDVSINDEDVMNGIFFNWNQSLRFFSKTSFPGTEIRATCDQVCLSICVFLR